MCQNKPIDFKCDTWSYGLILYFMLAGEFPVREVEDPEEQKQVILTEEISWKPLRNRQVSEHAIDLVQKCLKREPEQRLKIAAVLKHNWFKK